MRCGEAKRLFSPYLDGAVTGAQMQALSKHLETCLSCSSEYADWRQAQHMLGTLKTVKTPPDLALKLRVAVSREAAESRRSPVSGFVLRLQNSLDSFAIPATGGLITAVVIFGLFMGFLTLPPSLQANDVPLTFYTEPVLQQTPFGLGSISEDSLVIETIVDENGRVQDYRILSTPDSSQDLGSQVKKMLIFTTFRPATWMGRPTQGRAVLTFSRVSVKG
jgi:hypothetical protein